MTSPDPYGRSIFHGKLLDNATIAALKLAEARLGYELTIVQGIGGAKASAGTHLEGRAVDLTHYDAARKVRVLEDIGFAVWARGDLPGVWAEHVHGILIFENRANSRGLADSGWRQIGSFDRGRDGLAGDGVDPNNYRPSPPAVFTRKEYDMTSATPPKPPVRNEVTRARDRLVEAIHAAGQAAALLDNADPSRVRAKAQLDEIRAARRALRASLDAMPKK